MLELRLELWSPDSKFRNTSIITQAAYIPDFLRENSVIYSGKNLHNESESMEEMRKPQIPPDQVQATERHSIIRTGSIRSTRY